jgi:hypothetical protein
MPAETAHQLTAERPSPGRKVPSTKRGNDPISRPARLWSGKNGNAPEARFIRQLRAALIHHSGGQPSATLRIAVERAVMLAFHLAKMDAQALAAGGMSDHARKQYLAWDGSLRRALQALGPKATLAPSHTLAQILAAGLPARARAAPTPLPGAEPPAALQPAGGPSHDAAAAS